MALGKAAYVVDAIRRKWLDVICSPDKDTRFFVGDQHTRPGQFLVLGAFYPEPVPVQAQFQLALAP